MKKDDIKIDSAGFDLDMNSQVTGDTGNSKWYGQNRLFLERRKRLTST
ncbi:MAG: hypothetical protein LBJ63_04715 [Prevotellaceae bacterium]|nr:hypothetical protein [Prevotellaceae bacterium]